MTELDDSERHDIPLRPPVLRPEEQWVYQGLVRIAPAASQMYLDACALVSDASGLRSRQHLVAHLLREIESTLTAMLDPCGKRQQDSLARDGQVSKHKRIAETLGLAEEEPWLRAIALRGDAFKPDAWVHRRGVDRLRDDDARFTEFWNAHLDLFAALVDLFERRAARIQQQIVELTGVPPSKSAARTLERSVPRDPVSLKQLFDGCSDPAWLPYLRAAGFFASAPEAVYDAEQMEFRFPGWPAGEYLSRMAAEPSAAREVTEILEELPPSDNPYTYHRIVAAAMTLPVELSVRLVFQVLTGVRMRRRVPIGTDVSLFAAHLAEHGQLDSAYNVADELLQLRAEEGPLARRASSSLGDWEFSEVCKTLGPTLIAADPMRAFGFASDRLQQSLTLSAPDTHHDWDMSEYWQPSLTGEQDREREPRNALVSFTREASMAVVSASLLSIEEAVMDLRARGSLIFDRLALHLVAAHPTANLALAARLAFEEEPDEEERTLNEVARLQAVVFPLVSAPTAARFLECVDAGPGSDLDEWRERFLAAKQAAPTEADAAEYIAWWKPRRLFPVLEHLDADRQTEYDGLVRLLKQSPCWDDYQVFRVRTFWGDEPPIDESLLAEMSLDAIVEYLRTWEPSDDFGSPTPRGMARQLQAVVEKDPMRFADGVEQFLDLRQEYVDAVIHGLTQVTRAAGTFDWDPVLRFLLACTVDHRYQFTGTERSEGDETLGASANLLEAGFTSGTNGIPGDRLDDVWPILAPVFDDPNPTVEHERRYGGSNMDPFMLSLNTVRGKATHALLALLLEKARVAGEFERPLSDRRGITRWPHLAGLLDRCLDLSCESSLAVRAAIGARLDRLALIDPHWFEQHQSALFPMADAAHREVVFDSYLLWGTIREPLVPLFRDEYLYRAERLSDQPAVTWERRAPQEALVRHIVAMYLHGSIELDDELMGSAYSGQNRVLWGAATARVYLGLGAHTDTPEHADPGYLRRAVRLWQWRIQLAAEAALAGDVSDFRAELGDFGHWVISRQFEESWWIDQLDHVTALIGRVELDGPVLDAVADVAERHATQAARVATELLTHDPWTFLCSAHGDAFRRIIQAAVDSGDPDAIQEGRDLANRLVRRGHDEFGSFAIS